MSAFRVVEVKCLHGQCYGAKCNACGQWLTKHDWDEEDATACAEDALTRTDRWRHECPSGQLVLA